LAAVSRNLLVPIVLAGVTACGGATGTTDPVVVAGSCSGPLAGEPVRSNPGARACTEPCLTAHASACAEGDVWKVRFGEKFQALFGTLRISATGLARLEQPDRNLYGADGELWVSCIPRCGEIPNVCFPMQFETTVRIFSGVDDCTITTTPAEPWNGHASVTARFACNLGTFEARAVPDLVAVRDAMHTAGLLDENDPALDLDALVVSLFHEGATYVFIEDVIAEPCEALRLPEGHQIHATLADFEVVAAHWKEIWGEDPAAAFQTKGDVPDAVRSLEQKLCTRYAQAGD
jgi:hypothetical protein